MKKQETKIESDVLPVGFTNKYNTFAEEIYQLVGEQENFQAYRNCMTRLRFEIKDKTKVDEAKIKKIAVVKGINWSGKELQIIIGGEVYKVKEALDQYIKNGHSFEMNEFQTKQKFEIINFVKGVVVPIIPVLIGASLLQALYTILGPNVLNVMPTVDPQHLGDYSWFNVLLYIIAFPGTNFMGIFFLYNTVKYFKGDANIALLLGVILISPYFMNQIPAMTWTTIKIGDVQNIIGIKPYPTSVIPMIGAGLIYVFLDKWIKTWMPTSVDIIFRPFLTILITTFVTFTIVGNALGLVEAVLAFLINYLKYIPYGIGVGLFAIIWQPLVLTGTHLALINTLIIPAIADANYSIPIIFGTAFAVFGQLGACAGIALKTKNSNLRANSVAALPAAVFGITEPLIYGSTLKSGKPFLFGCLASGVGAVIYAGIFGGEWYMPLSQGIFSFVSLGNANIPVSGLTYAGWALGIIVSIILAGGLVLLFFQERPDEIKSVKRLNRQIMQLATKNIHNNPTLLDELKRQTEQINQLVLNNLADNKKIEKIIIHYLKENLNLDNKENKLNLKKTTIARKSTNAYKKHNVPAVKSFNEQFYALDNNTSLNGLRMKVNGLAANMQKQLDLKTKKNAEILNASNALVDHISQFLHPNQVIVWENKYFNIIHSLEIGYELIDKKPIKAIKEKKVKTNAKIKIS